jgi:hypothetical protein
MKRLGRPSVALIAIFAGTTTWYLLIVALRYSSADLLQTLAVWVSYRVLTGWLVFFALCTGWYLGLSELTDNAPVRGTPLRRFAGCFVSTRVLEAIWIVITLNIALWIEQLWNGPPIVDRWEHWTIFNMGFAGIVVLTWYYLALGYILVSGLVSFAAWRYWKNLSGPKYGALNLVVFCAHSTAAIILLLASHGQLTAALCAVWLAVVLYNATVPPIIWRYTCVAKEARA